MVVKNGSIYNFGATNASKAVVANTAATSPLAASSNAAATNYVTNTSDAAYTSGTLSMASNAHQTNTLVVNTGTTAGVLNLAGNDLTFATNGLLVTGSGNYTLQNGRLGNGTSVEIDLHQYSTGTLALAANINTASSPFVIAGSGNVVLSGSNTGTGAIDLGGSGTTTLQTGFAMNNNAIATSGLAKLDLNGLSITTTGAVTNYSVNAGGIANSGALATLTMGNNSQAGTNSNFSGNLNVVLNAGGNASVILSSFSNTGSITVNNNGTGGVLLGNAAAGNIQAVGIGSINNTGSISNNGTGTGALAIASNLGGNVTGVTQNSTTSTLTLAGFDTAFGGAVTLAAGTKLNLGSATALGGNGSATGTGGALTLGGNNTIDNSNGAALVLTTANALNLNGDFTFVGSNNLTFGTGPVTLANGTRTLTLSANTLTLNGPVGDGNQGYGITKFGNGSLTFSGSNSYGGATAFNGGTLTVNGATGMLANTSAVTLSGGATLNLGDAAAGNGLANRINPAAPLTLGGTNGAGQTASSNAAFTLVNGSTVPNSQSLASLTVTGFSNDTVNGNGTSNKATLTFTGANPYVRSAGGFVNLDDTNLAAIAFTNAPSGAGNVVNGMLIGAVRKGNDFISAQSGALTNATYGSNALGDLINTDVSADLPAASGNTNSLRFNNSTLNTVTLTGASVVNSGGILVGSGATNGAVITGGTLQAPSGGELWVYLNGKNLAINSVIGDNNTSSLNVGGSGILTLNGANTYTGTTTIVGGTLAIGAAGSTSAGSTISVNAGTTLSNSGAVNGAIVDVGTVTNNGAVNGAITAYGTVTNSASGVISQPATLNSGAAFTNSGTAGTVAVNIGATATINGGSVTGAVTENGTLIFGNTTNTALAVGNISGTGSGVITYSNTLAAGNTLNFASGANSFTNITNNSVGGKLVLTGTGSTNTIASNGLQSGANASATTEFQSGIYNFSSAWGNSAANQLGTWNITGATVNLTTGARYFASAGGTLNISAGAFNVPTDRFNNEQQAGGSSNTINVSGSGLLDLYNLTYGWAPGNNTTNNLTDVYNQTGGLVQSGVSANTYVTGLTLGNTTSTGSTFAYNFSGGAFRTASIASAGAAQGTSSISFNWTGGTLTVGTYTAANLTSYDDISAAATGTLFNGGGTLAPGFLGSTGTTAGVQFTGKTTITGNYQVDAPGAALAIDLSGTTAATAFKDTLGKFDNVAVTGTATLGGALNVSLVNTVAGVPFVVTPANSFTILTGGTVTGAFASGTTVTLTNDPFVGTMAVNVTGSSVYLNGYSGNEYTVTGGTTTWGASGTSNWTKLFDPNGNAYGAKFGSIGGGGTVTLDQDRTVGILVLDNTNGYTLSGANTLTLQGSGTATASVLVNSGTHTVAAPVALGSNLAITGSNGTQLTVSGAIAGGSQNLSLSGGKLILSGSNSYGATTISSGTLQVGTGGVSGNLGSGSISNNGSLIFNRADTVTVSTGITGTGALVQAGAGQLALIGANTYSGATTVNSGTLAVSGGGSLGNGSYAANILNNGALAFNTSANQTLSGIISGTGTVTQSGPGTLTLSGSNNFTGNLLINAGTVVDSYTPDLGVGNTVYLGANSGSNSATLSFGGGGQVYPNAINLGTTSGSLTLASTSYLSVSGPITGSHDLIFNAAGNTIILTGTNSGFTGNVTLYGGLVPRTSALSAANTLAVAVGAFVDLNGNSGLTVAGLNDVSGAGGVIYNSGGVNRTLTLGGSGNYSFGGILTSTELPVVVNLSGGGMQTFTGPNSYGTTTTINGGTLSVTQLANPAPASTTWTTTSGTNVATVASASGLASGMAIGTVFAGITFPVGTTIVGISGTTVTLSANATVSSSATAVTFGNANGLGISSNAAADLTINGGTLQFSGSNSSMSSTDRLFTVGLNGATLDASGSVPVNFINSGAVAYAGTGTHLLTLAGANTGANTLAASIANSGTSATSVTKSGAGTWVLSGSNSYSGGTTVNGGTLSVGADQALGAATGSVTIHDGATLQTSASFTTNASRTVILSGSATIDTQANTNTIAATLSASTATLVKQGSGTLTLSGSVTMAGLNANNGTVQLAQSGSIGAIAVAAGATVALGNHSGSTCNVLDTSSLTLAGSTSTLVMVYDNSGTQVDLNQALLKLAYVGDFNADGVIDSSDYALLDTYAQAGSTLGDLTGDGLVDISDYGLLDTGCQNQVYGVLAGSGGTAVPQAASANSAAAPASPEAVPEPGTLGMLLAGAIGLLGFRRKSARNKGRTLLGSDPFSGGL